MILNQIYCDKCLEKDWKYKIIDNNVIASCVNCNFEITFPLKKEKGKEKIFLSEQHKKRYEKKNIKFQNIENWKRIQKNRLDIAIKLQDEEKRMNLERRQRKVY